MLPTLLRVGLLGFDLLRPELALLLFVVALLPLIALASDAGRRRALARLCERRHVARLFPGYAGRRSWLRTALACFALLLLVFAYLGPVRGYSLVPVQRRGVDLIVAIDSSRSMLVQDVDPNRLERARRELRALFEKLEGERVGLIAFAGAARDVAPLTRDLDTVRFFLDRLNPDDNRAGGTDLGAALRLALERFDGRTGAHEAIVLVTDGEDLTGEGFAAAEEAAAKGIKVHVLGMGTEGGGKIPDGRAGFVVDADGREVVSRLEDATLRGIASVTGGVYVRAHGSVLPLEKLYERGIAGMEGREIVEGKERIPQDRYQWPLVLALMLMLVESALRERRRIGLERANLRDQEKKAA